MFLWSLALLCNTFERVVDSIFTTLFYLCLAIAIGHYTGWIERWIWFVLEKEAGKIVNGAKVTLGSFRLDWSAILQGRIRLDASNVVLHTPQRQLWGWESPLIARIGKASVEVNAPITIVHDIFLRKKLPLEIYSVYLADVQVFVERHDQVINVYLCDPAAILPPPPYLSPLQKLPESVDFVRSRSDPLMGARKSPTKLLSNDDDSIEEELMGIHETSHENSQQEKHKEQAQKLVNDMLQAVQSLGRAAQRGDLHTAVKQQGLEIAERLRDGLSSRSRNTSNLEQGVALIEQVGKVAVESLKAPKLILPERKTEGDGPKPPLARVGRIVLNDIRVFTKDSWIQITHDEKDSKQAKVKEHTGAFGSDTPLSFHHHDEPAIATKRGNWNRPIYIESLVLRASELCPPMSLKDPDNADFPAVYQPIDKIVNVVFRRLLAEMAKSNAGRLFSTAVGEVLSFIQSNPQQNHTSNSSTATSSTTTTSKNELKFSTHNEGQKSNGPLNTSISTTTAVSATSTTSAALSANVEPFASTISRVGTNESTEEVHV